MMRGSLGCGWEKRDLHYFPLASESVIAVMS